MTDEFNIKEFTAEVSGDFQNPKATGIIRELAQKIEQEFNNMTKAGLNPKIILPQEPDEQGRWIIKIIPQTIKE